MTVPQDHHILVIIGPSGVGKSTIVQALQHKGRIEVTPTYTTRPPRRGEAETPVEHRFVTDRAFQKLESEGFFLETVSMFNLEYRYGLPKISLRDPKRIALIMMRAPLMRKLSAYYSNYTTYQIEDTRVRASKRLALRQDDGEQLGTRLDDYEAELQLGRTIADRVFHNSKIETTVRQIEEALREDFDS